MPKPFAVEEYKNDIDVCVCRVEGNGLFTKQLIPSISLY